MNQKKIADVLKLFAIAAALVGAVLFFWYLPSRIHLFAMEHSLATWIEWLAIIWAWLSVPFFCAALLFFWRICTRIGEKNSFCSGNVKDMTRIGICAFLFAGMIIVGDVFLLFMRSLTAQQCFILFFLAFAALGVGMLCLCLAKLIENAAEIKQENDLTV